MWLASSPDGGGPTSCPGTRTLCLRGSVEEPTACHLLPSHTCHKALTLCSRRGRCVSLCLDPCLFLPSLSHRPSQPSDPKVQPGHSFLMSFWDFH